MTIREAYRLINDGLVETDDCGLTSNPAFAFTHEGTRYMLSEIKGLWIRLTVLKAPSQVIDEIKLNKEGS